ncbi:hypothetical protein AX17_002787 [Amanita inopinata Kibby_2008]|nr:hypothetical protein AX17_002787 [Amanita inopinata Kibby_2008]
MNVSGDTGYDIDVCLRNERTLDKLIHYPFRNAHSIRITADPTLSSPSSRSRQNKFEEDIYRLLKSLAQGPNLSRLHIPLILPSHTPTLVSSFAKLTELWVDSIPMFATIYILLQCPKLVTVGFGKISWNSEYATPVFYTERQRLEGLKSFTLREGVEGCHVMDVLHHFGCPALEKLEIFQRRIEPDSAPEERSRRPSRSRPSETKITAGEKWKWYDSTETAFKDFMLHSSANLQQLSVYDDNAVAGLDRKVPDILRLVFGQGEKEEVGRSKLRKVWLPRLTSMPFYCAPDEEGEGDAGDGGGEETFLSDFQAAVSLFSCNPTASTSTSTPIFTASNMVQLYIEHPIIGPLCSRHKAHHEPLPADSQRGHSTGAFGGAPYYVFACSQCPEKRIQARGQAAIEMFAERAGCAADVRVNDKVVVYVGNLMTA